jgi:glycosyltransferase involved in cell wall biosynthesis
MMKLAVVTPRYGREIAGGAETAARLLAMRVAARDGWRVTALTTCARDATTWTDDYAPGRESIDGVEVHRFPVSGPRHRDFDALTDVVIGRGRRVRSDEEEAWLLAQGPIAPGLIDAIAQSDADVIAFHPFLYHPTVAGLPLVARRSVLHSAAHDEPALRLPMYRSLFARAAGLAYWSDSERHVVERRFAVASKPAVVVGLGVDAGSGAADAARAAVGLDDTPYLLCLGRVDDGKGAHLLAELFARYRERRPAPLKLVLAGPVVHAPRTHPDIIVTGTVDEPTKWGLLRGALALASPSAFESFSIVLMESWTVGTPVLVNARCEVTTEHVARSKGGISFGTYAEFEVAVDRLVGDAALRTALGGFGRSYVEANYRWPDVIDRYTNFLAGVGAASVAQ